MRLLKNIYIKPDTIKHSTWAGPIVIMSHGRDKVLTDKTLTLSSPVLPISF